MLTKMVDGKICACSEEEERLIRLKWNLNETYPEYRGRLMFDGASEPKHDLMASKFYHRQLIEAVIQKKIAAINLKIEAAEEAGDENSKKTLLQARKSLKSQTSYDDTSWKTIDDLKKHLETIQTL